MRIMRMGVPGIWLEWYEVPKKGSPKKITGKMAEMLDEAWKDGRDWGLHRAESELERLLHKEKTSPIRDAVATENLKRFAASLVEGSVDQPGMTLVICDRIRPYCGWRGRRRISVATIKPCPKCSTKVSLPEAA